jgi:protoporphyrinogen oxidase
MWETVAAEVVLHGGEVHLHQRVAGFRHEGLRITAVETVDERTGERRWWAGDHVLSSMPLKDFAEAYGEGVPEEAAGVARGLIYRDFVTVGVLLSRLKIQNESGIRTVNDIVPDNWIYIQEPEVKIGRLQIFNNWSPYLVQDPDKVWIGVEYFCNEGDAFWSMADPAIAQLAVEELAAIGVISREDALDSVVIRAPKTYPAYFGTYDRFEVLRAFLDGIENLYPIGRNGMHKYNNQDHSMLCAMTAVDLVAAGSVSKEALWAVNTEQDYQEEK